MQLVVVFGGTSEVPGVMPRLRVMLKDKNIISTEDQVVHLAGQSSWVAIRLWSSVTNIGLVCPPSHPTHLGCPYTLILIPKCSAGGAG